MGSLEGLSTELGLAISSWEVWVGIVQAVLLGGALLVFGVWVARLVGLLDPTALPGETISVGLGSGLMVFAAWFAAIGSAGRSTFTPVAIGFAIAICVAVTARQRGPARHEAPAPAMPVKGSSSAQQSTTSARFVLPVLGAAAFLAVAALLYGSTMTLQPREGLQPIEFWDEAYYSILGADLAATGTESIYSPSGLTDLPGLPMQTWYHWGEIWLSAAAIKIFGAAPLVARHFIALPLLLLAAATLTGTLVRRVTKSTSASAFLLGFFACLFLAPVPLIAGPWFSSWAAGLILGVTMYGLAAVAVLFAMYAMVVVPVRKPTLALTVFTGCAAAMILPAHIVIAMLALVGVCGALATHALRSLAGAHRLATILPIWRPVLVSTGVAVASTVAWGLFTDHGLGASGLSKSVTAFNGSWRESVAIITLGAGTLLFIPIAWVMVRREDAIQAGIYVGTAILLIIGVLVWGARLGDFNTFHAFFGGIVVFATPVAAIAVWTAWTRLRASGHRLIAFAAVLLCVSQIEFGFGLGIIRLQLFGPGTSAPVPVELLDAVRSLPADAKIAYSCQPAEEVAFWDARLIGITAHTGRPMIAMCFQSEVLGALTGTEMSVDVPSPLFELAPQRRLYPESGSQPSSASVSKFFDEHGIGYVYADPVHPNAFPIPTTELIRVGGFELRQVQP